jgi:hypothetical protein
MAESGDMALRNFWYLVAPGRAVPAGRTLAKRLADEPILMLIDDADTQAKWFAHLKREWQRAADEGRPFENPVRARTLRWHS